MNEPSPDRASQVHLPTSSRSMLLDQGMSEARVFQTSTAESVIVRAERLLWSVVGTKAKQFLDKLGLRDETIRSARLGYWIGGEIGDCRRVDEGFIIPRGILIPYVSNGVISAITVRLPVANRSGGRELGRGESPRQFQRYGTSEGLYPGPSGVVTGLPLIIVRNELDALLLTQELGPRAGVVALDDGNAQIPIHALDTMLRASPWIWAGSADDEAWSAGVRRLAEWDRFTEAAIPAIYGSEWTAAQSSGLDVHEWWTRRLAKILKVPRTAAILPTSTDEQFCGPVHRLENEPINPHQTRIRISTPPSSEVGRINEAGRETVDLGVFPALHPTIGPPNRWRCGNPYCQGSGSWWKSIHNVVLCANCQPPASSGLVIASGDSSNAPEIYVNRSPQTT